MDISREVVVTLRHPPEATITITLRVLCTREDSSTLPEDRESWHSDLFCDRFTRTRFFMLQRGNLRRSLDDLLLVKQGLLREVSRVIADRTAGPNIALRGPFRDRIFIDLALHLENVLKIERYSYLQKMPVEMACKVVMLSRERLELLQEVAIQESMEYPGDSRAFPASQEAIASLEMKKLDSSSQEDRGSAGEPCAICLEDLNVRQAEVACMPCKHEFHHSCVFRWLKMSNSCPLCRYAMPTSLSDVD